MTAIAQKKIHFAPLARQDREIRRVLRSGRHRNVTELMRAALDAYLESPDRASLRSQAEQMAAEFVRSADDDAAARMQDASRASRERW